MEKFLVITDKSAWRRNKRNMNVTSNIVPMGEIFNVSVEGLMLAFDKGMQRVYILNNL